MNYDYGNYKINYIGNCSGNYGMASDFKYRSSASD